MKKPTAKYEQSEQSETPAQLKRKVKRLQKRIHLAKAVLSERTTEDQLNTLADALKMKFKGGA
jgi:hypothetical protein